MAKPASCCTGSRECRPRFRGVLSHPIACCLLMATVGLSASGRSRPPVRCALFGDIGATSTRCRSARMAAGSRPLDEVLIWDVHGSKTGEKIAALDEAGFLRCWTDLIQDD